MAKPEWGAKRVCQNCGAKFYDFNRSPILCPSCGGTYQPDDALRPRRSRVEPKSRPAAKPVLVEEAAEEEPADEVLLDDVEEEEDETEAEAEEVLVEDDEEDEVEADVKVVKPVRDPLVPGDEVEDEDALDEDDLEDEDEEEFEDDEK